MVLLTREEYAFIYGRLKKQEDVELLHKRMGLPKDLLFNVLGKKIVRDATKRFYAIKHKSEKLRKRWKRGESIVDIADDFNFPPALMASFIMEAEGFSKKKVKIYIKNPHDLFDVRLRRDVKEALEEDFAYSPSATEIQAKNGKIAEKKIEDWLKKKKVKYITEKEGRKRNHVRTPDFLLRSNLVIWGKRLKWIESKASFADERELEKDYKKQLRDYIKYFGEGAVVYWHGHLKGLRLENTIILSGDFFKKKKKEFT